MGSDEVMPVGKAYAYDLLTSWSELSKLATDVRIHFQMGNANKRQFANYTSKLAELWIELHPKVVGRNDRTFGSEMVKEFESFQKYAIDPNLLMSEPIQSIKLQILIRDIIEKLKVTDFEGIQI